MKTKIINKRLGKKKESTRQKLILFIMVSFDPKKENKSDMSASL